MDRISVCREDLFAGSNVRKPETMIVTSVHSRSWREDLPSERARLVRLCARLTGSYEAAEDLAQETLYETWRRADNVRDAEAWRSFVSGVAKNVCLRWQRQQGREAARR